MNEFGKFPHYIFFLLFINLIHLKLGGYSLPFYISIISFTIYQHFFPKLCFVNIAIYIGMIYSMKKRLSNIHWWFIISNACILKKNLMYCSKNTSKKQDNVVNIRTNICHTYGCNTRTSHKNIYRKKKRKKKNCCHSCISNHGMIYCYIPSSCKVQL